MTNPFNLSAHLIRERAKNARQKLLRMNYRAGQGHTGADLSEMDILLCLYLNIMRYCPHQYNEDRDRFILSKGHGVGGFYACLAECGFVDEEHLHTFLEFESRFPGHPVKSKLPQFVEVNTGALGHGLPIAAGLALANKKHGRSGRVFVLLGDGELAEGSNWEALMAAAKFQLNNLIVIVDRNTLQLAGKTEEIMPLEPLDKKAEAFGLSVRTCNGNDPQDIIDTIHAIHSETQATFVIAKTQKGYGVSFIQDKAAWHHKVPSETELHCAIQELE